ncbi:enoyl-CoA hydratase-related protein [Amycolatopsis thermophila]|uniref:Enoyl-CoA hydratase n=1 Tax=Amycolatopsis thermophila TaxID=206084 RepID=A0ABU0F5G5_9PSEU|nr:enoyl-CoA hydratase-related protein [Amycolatopsis thermophila]MDQ0382832.1 enoyl-CoA hydratase [Amycolatopsis thermophila]
MSPTTTRTIGPVLVITIDRPHVHNAVDHAVLVGMRAALERLESAPELRAGVLTGAGATFCSGADLRARLAGERVVDDNGFAGLTRRRRTKPLIAAAEGNALGGGMELALACDIVVAARDARFGLPEVRRAVLAAEGGLYRSASVLGRKVAMQLALTGEPIDAERAHQLGLVNELTDSGKALETAVAIAERIAANAPESVRQSKRVIDESAGLAEDDAWALTQEAYAAVKASPEFQEGARAFVARKGAR